jgi:hypothetical protein
MFIRFRSGGVGHKAMREWDDLLLSDGAPNVIDDDIIDLDFEGGEDDLEEGEGHQDEEENDSDVDADEDEPEVDDPDAVIADSDEELDDDIFAQEGYDTL